MKAPILYSPRMGLGDSLALYTETAAVVIEDYMFISMDAGDISPLTTGTAADFNDAWDFSGSVFTEGGGAYNNDPTITHTADANIEVMKTVANAMANAHGGFVVIQDDLGTAFSSDGATIGAAMTDLRYPSIASTGTAVAVDAVALTGI